MTAVEGRCPCSRLDPSSASYQGSYVSGGAEETEDWVQGGVGIKYGVPGIPSRGNPEFKSVTALLQSLGLKLTVEPEDKAA